ncbi:hypothetical protein RP20_CCG005221 [Aedes albopictus]|nr:hypothetical protein RP20_CCG005221 [Aedes albopictus]
MVCHPDYNSTSFQHDVAVLALATPVVPESVEIACLANVGTEHLQNAVVQTASFQKSMWTSTDYRASYEYFGTEEECYEALQPRYNDTFLKPGRTCVINDQFKKAKFSGSFFHSIDNRDCTFTVIAVGSFAVHNPDIVPGWADTKINIGIVHRVAYYLDWIEQAVWEEEFAIKHKWKLVNKARNIQGNALSFTVLFLGVRLLAYSY